MKVRWTDTAEGHLEAIYSYISLDSPQYAKQMVDRIIYYIKPDQIDILAVIHGHQNILRGSRGKE